MNAIIPHIVEQHAEEAAFLWLLRATAVKAPHYDLKDLARLDERVEAHIDGLRVAGEPGWTIALSELDRHQEDGEV
ncbi:MAG: TIGR02270 family protein, partial [Geminicoccaceae bacterium]